MPLSNGHINLFADLEEHTAALAARASKSKPAMTDSDRGISLAPTKQDLHPWYSAAGGGSKEDKVAEARKQQGFGMPTQNRPAILDPFASQAALALACRHAAASTTLVLPTTTITETTSIFGLARRLPRS
jgi:hypothetical protein